MNKLDDEKKYPGRDTLTRRRFCSGMLLTSADAASLNALSSSAKEQQTKEIEHKIKTGIVGLGHRGMVIGNLCMAHGGYEITAVADYFEDVVDEQGEHFGVPENGQFLEPDGRTDGGRNAYGGPGQGSYGAEMLSYKRRSDSGIQKTRSQPERFESIIAVPNELIIRGW